MLGIGGLTHTLVSSPQKETLVMEGKSLLHQLVRPDITPHSLWSPHPSLISRDILDTAVTGGDAIDGRTPREQGMGLG